MTEKTITLRVLGDDDRTRVVRLHTYNADATIPQYRVLGPSYRAESFRIAKLEWDSSTSPALAMAAAADPGDLGSLRDAQQACRTELETALAAGRPLDTKLVGAYDTLGDLLTIDGADLP